MRSPLAAFAAALTLLAWTSGVGAETVFVKYRGSVDLAPFRCATPSSSFVHRVCFRAERQYLVVLLGNTYYHYCRMPSAVVQRWLASPSQGRFYNATIKGNYDCRLGGVPE